MPRVVPRQVVALIDRAFPAARKQQEAAACDRPVERFVLASSTAENAVAGLLSLIDQLRDELLVIEGDEYAEFLIAVAAIRTIHVTWQSGDMNARGVVLAPVGTQLHPVSVVRRALSRCPDEIPSRATADLLFVLDGDLRELLRLDISSVNQALSNGEWKAATVLAGSVVEALLLWALQQPGHAGRVDGSKAGAKMLSSAKQYGCSASTASAALEYGDLGRYLDIAKEIGGVLEDETWRQADLARNFRNLIHPGRAQRLGTPCDRGTALAAVAALEHTVRDLTPRTN